MPPMGGQSVQPQQPLPTPPLPAVRKLDGRQVIESRDHRANYVPMPKAVFTSDPSIPGDPLTFDPAATGAAQNAAAFINAGVRANHIHDVDTAIFANTGMLMRWNMTQTPPDFNIGMQQLGLTRAEYEDFTKTCHDARQAVISQIDWYMTVLVILTLPCLIPCLLPTYKDTAFYDPGYDRIVADMNGRMRAKGVPVSFRHTFDASVRPTVHEITAQYSPL
ncbi:hypothetical protein K438DRAFT_1776969 [Mycena galopus ATCC 62051]|nr:hypothetical protein K438DRAFT_1776969 [Mycena galopus ATCC 62051]